MVAACADDILHRCDSTQNTQTAALVLLQCQKRSGSLEESNVSESSTGGDTVVLSITNNDGEAPLLIPQLASNLMDLHSLVFVSTLATFFEWEELKLGEPRSFKSVYEGALSASLGFNVEKLSYNSPLDVVVAAKTAIPVAVESASRLVKLVSAIEDLRVKHARTNNEVLAENIIRDELKLERFSKKQISKAERDMLQNAIAGAARAADRIAYIHVQL